ncbi:agmatine deiminase family protein [Streptoalloteichus hindustanus]|uniref:Agmatine deiminase n=1 Tax=Streptoalloteichus hindustanus TaxID=2017 RepID=A0A1M5DIC5_STRHI|nr:agmatine deiminase family protein [Streptoalloteichus hindustanus]SHF66676.1 agmatine deiminase [Streptoalloteichus hindustanus]
MTGPGVRMPAETAPHLRCWMAWPARRGIWGGLLPHVRTEIAQLARVIAEFEPVVMLAAPRQVEQARRALGGGVAVVPMPVDDVWIRDTGPIFVHDAHGRVAGVDLAFNGWGGRQRHRRDRHVARRLLDRLGLPRASSRLVIEPGGFESDGDGTALATRSCLLHPARNRDASPGEVERELATLLGVREVVWLDGVPDLDVTDCHVDGLARFVQPGLVVVHQPVPGSDPAWERVTHQALEVLAGATDARGRRLRVVTLPEPTSVRVTDPALLAHFVAGYVNYYVANDAVVMPRFGDRASDDRAAGILGDLYPGRRVVAVDLDTLLSGGGGIHCVTRDQPRPAPPAPR